MYCCRSRGKFDETSAAVTGSSIECQWAQDKIRQLRQEIEDEKVLIKLGQEVSLQEEENALLELDLSSNRFYSGEDIKKTTTSESHGRAPKDTSHLPTNTMLYLTPSRSLLKSSIKNKKTSPKLISSRSNTSTIEASPSLREAKPHDSTTSSSLRQSRTASASRDARTASASHDSKTTSGSHDSKTGSGSRDGRTATGDIKSSSDRRESKKTSASRENRSNKDDNKTTSSHVKSAVIVKVKSEQEPEQLYSKNESTSRDNKVSSTSKDSKLTASTSGDTRRSSASHDIKTASSSRDPSTRDIRSGSKTSAQASHHSKTVSSSHDLKPVVAHKSKTESLNKVKTTTVDSSRSKDKTLTRDSKTSPGSRDLKSVSTSRDSYTNNSNSTTVLSRDSKAESSSDYKMTHLETKPSPREMTPSSRDPKAAPSLRDFRTPSTSRDAKVSPSGGMKTSSALVDSRSDSKMTSTLGIFYAVSVSLLFF